MKHSDTSHSENTFGIHLSNKGFDNQMPINNFNSNAVMIGSMISTSSSTNQSTILSSALNTTRSNSVVLKKPNSASTSSISANMVGQLTYMSPNNNTIKLVNLSKCQQLSNLNKDSFNLLTNNAINVQFVTQIPSNTSISMNESTGLSDSATKQDYCGANKTSIVLTSSSSQSMTGNNSITGTRYIVQTTQTPILPHGPITIIPQKSEISGGAFLTNHLIKNARFALTGPKQTPQAIRPITACTASTINQQNVLSKQTISKISPAKSLNNYTINIPDNKSSIAIHDFAGNRHGPLAKDQQRSVTKTTPNTSINYTNNNIRLALTSNIPNSKVTINHPKVQLISPKTRKRSGSPVTVKSDVKSKDLLIVSKDENAENPSLYNCQLGACSPARKRARKQHLKGDINNKVQKLVSNNCSSNNINNISTTRHISNDKPISTPISIAPIITKLTSITTQNKVEDSTNTSTFVTTTNGGNPQIFIPLKTPIHICTSKTSSTVASIYTGHLNVNNCTVNTTPNITIPANNFPNQIQIITQNSQGRPPIQLSPIGNNLILSPTPGKILSSFSPQKIIHIAPTKVVAATNHVQNVKNEKLSSELASDVVVVKGTENKPPDTVEKDPMKLEVTEVKAEIIDDSRVKYSLFPYKYHWNARRSHFEKEGDVKIKKTKTSSNVRKSLSENRDDKLSTFNIDIFDTRWRLHKARNQLLMQKRFDEENLRKFHKLKQKFDFKPQRNDDNDEPIFHKVCLNQLHYDPLPDQVDAESLSEYTDPALFAISDDIIPSHINAISTGHSFGPKSSEKETTRIPHRCTDSCTFYLSEVPAISQPPHIIRILDLIEGLIVKETKIIEKESEINEQCLRLIESSSGSPLGFNRSHRKGNRIKVLNGRRW